jgi:glycosyltransferase involved in cell wall biosynthesis
MRITVIIPVFNAGKTLVSAVESVLQTKHPNLEILVINDGSTDCSRETAINLAITYAGVVRMVEHPDQANHGMTASRNLGIKRSTGEAICFLDADDLFLPHRFEISVPLLMERSAVDGVYEAVGVAFESPAQKELWGKRALLWPTAHIPDCKALLEAMLLNRIGTWQAAGVLVKKRLFAKTGLFTDTLRGVRQKVEDDTHLFYKMAAIGCLIPGEVTKPVALYRRHQENSWGLNRIEDTFRDIFVILYVLNWARTYQNEIGRSKIRTLKQGLRLQVITYLKMVRQENKRPKASALIKLIIDVWPYVCTQRLFWGNLVYALVGRE